MRNLCEFIRSVFGTRKTGAPDTIEAPKPPTHAPRFGLASYDAIASDFFEKILEMDYRQVYISSRSSLWDFYEEPEVYVRRVYEVYGVDIDDIKDGNLKAILKRLQKELRKK